MTAIVESLQVDELQLMMEEDGLQLMMEDGLQLEQCSQVQHWHEQLLGRVECDQLMRW